VDGVLVSGNSATGFNFGFTSGMSEVDFVGNYGAGAVHANAFAEGGGDPYPSRPTFARNRFTAAMRGAGFNLFGDAVVGDLTAELGVGAAAAIVQAPFDTGRSAATLVGQAVGNDSSDNFAAGLHVYT